MSKKKKNDFGSKKTSKTLEDSPYSLHNLEKRKERLLNNQADANTSKETHEEAGAFIGIPMGEPAEALYEFVDGIPAIIRKPLSLIEERAFAVTWVRVRPRGMSNIKPELRRLIIRDDGMIYGIGFENIDDLGIEVQINEPPKFEKLWSAAGIESYKNGERPEVSNVFHRVTSVINRFIDFNRSLADQRIMCEVLACYILSTWFLDAFNVIGFLWANGVRGSGKSQLLSVVAELGYLGEMVLTGSSFATLRDLSDYGATICFDDSETFASVRTVDGDKRALLLGGNKKGNTVILKERDSSAEGWRNRRVNTFSPRLFSAIQLPEEVLASRTIVIPLIRSTDANRANASPLDYSLWTHDRRRLLDDLWALSIENLSTLSEYELKAKEKASFLGRDLEPWLATLAVAAWLEDKGVKGVWENVEKVSRKYQKERKNLEADDLTSLIVRSLCRCIGYDISDGGDALEEGKYWQLSTSEIAVTVSRVASENDIRISPDTLTPNHIGIHLRQMRFNPKRTSNSRGWVVTSDELRLWIASLNLK